ncbi:MAG: 30S ribosomal protein S3 [Clostridiales bacterium]|nr:30S ribosomal protein S3 [Clostridiales bacterium]
MGQKVNPHGLRVGVIQDWDSRWFENDKTFGDTLVNDYNVRKYLKNLLKLAGVPKIEIERTPANVKVNIHCAKPGMVIGRGGSEIDKLRAQIEAIVKKPVSVSVTEIRQPDLNAQLVAENVAAQLEKRIAFRRAMKQSIGRTMRLGAKGIKITSSGRLGGAEIARSESYHEGTIPLQTIRADIDYGFAEANTTYGKIGIKCWIYKGEVLADKKSIGATPVEKPRERRNNDRGDRRNGGERKFNGERRFNGERAGNGERRPYNGPRTPREGGAK